MNHDENSDDLWGLVKSIDEKTARLELSAKNARQDIKKLFLHSARQEIAIEALQTVVAGIADATAAGFAENRERFDQQDKRFDQQDKRFDQLEQKFDARLNQQDKRFDQLEQKFDARLNQQGKRFDQLELLIRQLLPNSNN